MGRGSAVRWDGQMLEAVVPDRSGLTLRQVASGARLMLVSALHTTGIQFAAQHAARIALSNIHIHCEIDFSQSDRRGLHRTDQWVAFMSPVPQTLLRGDFEGSRISSPPTNP